MFERYQGGEQALLVHVDFRDETAREDLRELEMLATSAGATILGTITTRRDSPQAKFFVGTGKADEIAQEVHRLQADLVIFNHALTPAQERNLERMFECRVLDRTTLILDIFAQRARTHEGKLQVELAQLRHISSRLVRGWTHLERQKGGIGLRGPGETQLETDRRLIREKISNILGRLEKVEKQREQGRRARVRNAIPVVSLVGYTNAGKSTLFNRMTQSKVYAADQLFATLDPTLRRIELERLGPVVLADTVGFIRHLPHDLVAAFKATLQETREADLQLHVIDCADERVQDNMAQVNEVLHEIEADEVPQLLVYNKVDCLPEGIPRIERDDTGKPVAVWLSALTGEGTDLLLTVLDELLSVQIVEHQLKLPVSAARLRSRLYELKAIQRENYAEDGNCIMQIRLSEVEWLRLVKQEGPDILNFIVKQ
ncbi:ribosome rescue GTPase HflX [Tolumonas auensis]|uniref:ribosome rescue GTPase HflX n=1 Tax=Tolumonas auensis TaxID=43948 RepID=UPI002AA71CAA|nr:ribosome rescue GTPase HflX [Tolumonas auensis]